MTENTVGSLYSEKIFKLYSDCDEQLVRRIESIVEPYCEHVATRFYEEMLSDENAGKFLDTSIVNKRLHASMSAWVRDLFRFRNQDEVEPFIKRQTIIGDVHERIDMPMIIFDQGMLTIKEELNKILRASTMEPGEVPDALIFINSLLDYVTVIINERFMDSTMDHTRRSELLRAQSINANLAYECALLRTDLFSWFSDVLILLFKNDVVSTGEIDIWNSNVGLWVLHKARSIFRNNQEISKLDVKIEQIDADLTEVLLHHGNMDRKSMMYSIDKVKKHIIETDWIIESLEKTALEQDRGRDSLTNLFNRRYLPNILKSEMNYNRLKGSEFAILYIDIDNFKNINDTHGHGAGDFILNEVSYILLHSVRVGDYVFRYGGDEFLIVLTETTELNALQVAEKLRVKVESYIFSHENVGRIEVSLSIGVSLSRNEKDYERIIKKADQSLNKAKVAGKNKCVYS